MEDDAFPSGVVSLFEFGLSYIGGVSDAQNAHATDDGGRVE